ncbi:hypothetical protein PAXINDRAFT_155694 [Paxillus involutus ATCC 200175]|uniref:RRM domain-containing protein n=1 Tax=Paxillus involutus ATCC 200175 TaxID=664439 RepID=A0A0C9TYJ3_PAXIN|nr:hypothetical protein PAXINDRAFT_155694 [Paxillus involutus ATCC 200175]
MSPSVSFPPQTPVTTVDDFPTLTTKSPHHPVPSNTVDIPTKTRPDTPPSFRQPPAPPTPPDSSSRNNSLSASTSMSLFQPNSPSQSFNTNSSSFHNSPFCFSPTASKSVMFNGEKTVAASHQPSDSGIVNSLHLSTNFQSSITPSFSFPGTSSSDSFHERMFPDSAESQCSLTTSSSAESIPPSQRTPNVYINGLPPHFPEQELFALARSFGEVKSVRTFTRHVSEKPTGYGFVLFSDVDSAERCIEGLRKYRNIHPSFSKQVHRIPGTEYAQHAMAQASDHDMNTFKSRMEKLKDTASTNLYIEGLPLSIDEESLATLVLPYKIKSSRFFKTKLSDPPRIIAFVRLENRDAAEETIERLHGRMVRGWNDSGCRISVRFADSAEQRELRRAERALKNGDQSPARLTIAQAALLNLRGQELQANTRSAVGGQRHRVVNSQGTRLLSENHVAFNSTADSGVSLEPNSRPSNLHYAFRESPVLTTQDLAITSDMDYLLQSIQNMGYDDGLLDSSLSPGFSAEYITAQQAQLRALANAGLLSPNVLPITLPRGQTQAHNGFTPAEELILEAHARLQLQAQLSQRSPVFEQGLPLAPPSTKVQNSLRSSLNASVPSFNTSSLGTVLTPTAGASIPGRATFRQDMLPTISEDDFHATSHHSFNFAPNALKFQGSMNSGLPIGANSAFVRPPSRAVSIVPPPPDYNEHEKRSKGRHQRAEQSVESSQIPIHSFSFDGRPLTTSNGYTTQQPYQQAIRSNSITNNTSVISNHKNTEPQHNYIYSHGDVQGRRDEANSTHFRSAPTSHIHAQFSPTLGEQHSEGSKSPDVVSPALTYSSRTPSTLSPATPFFGSFTTGQEAFEVVTVENEEALERKLKARAGSK